jgi:integrase
MKSSWTGFQSPLALSIDTFLAHKRALGCLFRVEELSLRLFDRFLIAQSITTREAITPDVVDAFLVSRPRHAPRSYNHLRGTLVRLFDWLVAHDQFGPSPVRARPRRSIYSRQPFLFDDTIARRLLDTASQLPDKGGTVGRGATYRVIFTLLYGLGLRVGEVARLCVGDVDLTRDVLVIRQTKFYKSRLVPFGPRIHLALSDHLARLERSSETISPSTAVFSLRGGRPVSAGTISQTFHHLVPQLGLSIPAGTVGPRVHDLRHAFAVGTLLRWYRSGLDPSTRLLQLSTFLGHVSPVSTSVYLTTTPELLDEANARFERWARTAVTETTS